MNFEYLFSSPNGNISLNDRDLQSPFLIAPDTPHPFLTLAHYFSGLKEFLLKDKGKPINTILAKEFPEVGNLERVTKITVVSEKHGAFYHIARVRLHTDKTACSLALTIAANKNSRKTLKKEFGRLCFLNKKFGLFFLPRVYALDHQLLTAASGTKRVELIIGEWLSSYHEWHITVDKSDNKEKIVLWDSQAGNRNLSDKEAFEAFRQIAQILTYYYDIRTFQQITPWHHAAGDFVVKAEQNSIEVKLITARGYEPLPGFSAGETGIEIPLVVFFLNLILRIRLDRLDGVGEFVWIDSFAAKAAIKGFLDGLSNKEATGKLKKGFTNDFKSLLKTFSKEDFLEIYQQILSSDILSSKEEILLMKKRLSEHCSFACVELTQLK